MSLFTQTMHRKFTGIYWGAFDPATEAHTAIIARSITDIPLKKLMIVVNNHSYKNYNFSLEKRLQMMEAILQKEDLGNVELLWQDDSHPMDFRALRRITQEPLCAIAGYDAYKKWALHSTSYDRSCYEAIAVIPRGDEDPILFDKQAFLLPIDARYKNVSSSKVEATLCHLNALLEPNNLS